ncbi:MAG: hypothetical protein HW407_511 [Bacteroidetes bacterium]|nr:hypothetical protein [Bacteroidota bacterium]
MHLLRDTFCETGNNVRVWLPGHYRCFVMQAGTGDTLFFVACS